MERRGVAGAGRLDHGLGRARATAPRERRSRRLGLEAPDLPVAGLPARVDRQPARGPGDAARAAHEPAVGQDARADAGAHGQEHGVAGAARRAQPLLAEHVAGAIAVDRDRRLYVPSERVAQWDLVLAPEVGRPGPSRPRIVDARHDHAHAADARPG
jgi:hypothetical protein